MGRTPNDDRSDTMNPNNDAYWADQENRFGSHSADDDGNGSVTTGPSARPALPLPDPIQALADPELGKLSERIPFLPSASDLRWEFELAFATAESEARDLQAAVKELTAMSEQVLRIAMVAITRQGGKAELEICQDRLVLHHSNGKRAAIVFDGAQVLIRREPADCADNGRFTFHQRRWQWDGGSIDWGVASFQKNPVSALVAVIKSLGK